MRRTCFFLLAFLFSTELYPLLNSGIYTERNCHYGFYFVDVGITEEDLANFSSIDIRNECFYHQFGELSEVESTITQFLSNIGENEQSLIMRVAARLAQLTDQIMKASGRETAWVHLRASVPTDAYDTPRWHFDGNYFTPVEGYPMYKFATTLMGPPTLFYPISKELRSTALRHMLDRNYMKEFCSADQILMPKKGEGVVFLAGNKNESALHSEPPIHEKRLFFSITPCNEKQLAELQKKVQTVYPKDKN